MKEFMDVLPDSLNDGADKLWEDYHKDPTVENKNALLLYYLGLVKSIVFRMAPLYKRYTEYDELVNCGVIGLMDAINKYDMLKNVRFDMYARKRIRGEILDYLRKQDFISPTVRARIKKVELAGQILESQLGREATEEEIALHLGWDEKIVQKTLADAYQYNIIHFETSISQSGMDESIHLIDVIKDDNPDGNPEIQAEKTEFHALMGSLLDRLTKRERTVIELYYYEELLLRQIADILGVTESRVSQMHSKAIGKLKKWIDEEYHYNS